MRFKLHQFAFLLVSIFLLIVCVSAHPGRTDGDGGHIDHATGEYHYHHGYEAHQHTGGVCPYAFDDRTGRNSHSSSSTNAISRTPSSSTQRSSLNKTTKAPSSSPSVGRSSPEYEKVSSSSDQQSSSEQGAFMKFLLSTLSHLFAIPIALVVILVLYALICRWFDSVVDKRCDDRVKAAIAAKEKELSQEKARLEAYAAAEQQDMKRLHLALNNAIKIGFTKAPKQATEDFTRDLSIRFLKSRIYKFFPKLFPDENPLLWPEPLRDRLLRSVRDNIRIKNYDITATVIGSSGTEYNTTLTSCSCPDYSRHKPQPCKHIIYLHLHLGHAICEGAKIEKDIKQLQQTYDNAQEKRPKN